MRQNLPRVGEMVDVDWWFGPVDEARVVALTPTHVIVDRAVRSPMMRLLGHLGTTSIPIRVFA